MEMRNFGSLTHHSYLIFIQFKKEMIYFDNQLRPARTLGAASPCVKPFNPA